MDPAVESGMFIDPAGWSVTYRLEGAPDNAVMALDSNEFAPGADEACALDVSFDGEVIEFSLQASVPVVLQSCAVVLRHAFYADERVLMNGYQSWTTTSEQSAWSRMRGLGGVPSWLVDRYVLDGGGDYRFVDYSTKRGCLHGWTYAEFLRDETFVLVASFDETHGLTLIRTDASKGIIELQTEPPAQSIAAGERIVLGHYCIVEGERTGCYDRWFALAGIQPRTHSKLLGYSSWYRHYGEIDENKLVSDMASLRIGLDRIIEHPSFARLAGAKGRVLRSALASDAAARQQQGDGPLAPAVMRRGAGPLIKVAFQIDDGYCKVGDWLSVDSEKFPHGLAPLAKVARNLGFTPGIWIAPFVCERDSKLFVEHDEWLLRDAHGELVKTGCHWSGGYALDTRNIEVRSYVLEVLQTMSQEWGFSLFKVDFLYAACLEAHAGLNRGELMADAFDLLRTALEDDCEILACGVPLGPIFGKADYCRIGCDVGLDWDDAPHMRLLHRERVSTKNSLANTYGRHPLDGRAFGNDPDVFFLRDDVKLTSEQRAALLFADADMGSVLLTSDDMGTWSDTDCSRYNMALSVFLEDYDELDFEGGAS